MCGAWPAWPGPPGLARPIFTPVCVRCRFLCGRTPPAPFPLSRPPPTSRTPCPPCPPPPAFHLCAPPCSLPPAPCIPRSCWTCPPIDRKDPVPPSAACPLTPTPACAPRFLLAGPAPSQTRRTPCPPLHAPCSLPPNPFTHVCTQVPVGWTRPPPDKKDPVPPPASRPTQHALLLVLHKHRVPPRPQGAPPDAPAPPPGYSLGVVNTGEGQEYHPCCATAPVGGGGGGLRGGGV